MARKTAASEPLSHRELCDIASSWVKRPHSAGGHGCQIAFTETRIGFEGGESPDAIGFRAVGWADGSVLIECKKSRADFFADAKKPHRTSVLGMGRFRYYMCPEGLIAPEELPERWGLLYVTKRRRVVPVAGAVCALWVHCADGVNRFHEEWSRWTFEHDADREVRLLTKLLQRVGNAEQVDMRIRQAEGSAQRLSAQLIKLRRDLEEESRARWNLQHALDQGVAAR